MALSKSILKVELQKFADELFVDFVELPKDIPQFADKWSVAIDIFTNAMTPPSSKRADAITSFKNSMLGLTKTLTDTPYKEPFTIAYVSPELALFRFNNYLESIGYKSDPKLDKTGNFTILNKIRDAYNKLYPFRPLTTDDIKYNQSMYHEIYAAEIAAGTKRPLFPGTEPDGTIGDDTIKYKPTVLLNEFQNFTGTSKLQKQFALDYDNKVVGEPATSGDIGFRLYTSGTGVTLTRETLYFDYIKKGKSKDYLKFQLEKTQSNPPEIDYMKLDHRSHSRPIAFYKGEFEKNHAKHDPFWKKNGIKTIAQLTTFSKKKQIEYDAAPDATKNALTLLQNSLLIYALKIAEGMAPDYTAIPPVTPLIFTSVTALGTSGASSEKCLEQMSTLIYAWFKTGIAVNNITAIPQNWN